MRDLIELSPHVLPFAPNCPEPIMIRYLREAAITFCCRSRSWRVDKIYPLITDEIDIMASCDGVIHDIESVRWRQSPGDQWQEPMTPSQYEEIAGNYQDRNPLYFSQRLAGKLQVSPFTAGELRVIMYLKPDQQATEVPDYLVELHPDIIAAGALRKILMLPGYDFTQPQLAMNFAGDFEAACNSHFRDNLRGQQRARTRTKPNYF